MCERGAEGSGERHSVLEFAGGAIGSEEPFEIFLEDALVAVAEVGEQSIEAALGGSGLPATVEQSDEVFADFSDLVAVQADDADALLRIVMNRGVPRLPVAGGVSSGIHLSFDLAHDALRLFGVGVGFPPPVDLSIGYRRWHAIKLCHLVDCHTIANSSAYLMPLAHCPKLKGWQNA